jgi:hypothetical protein
MAGYSGTPLAKKLGLREGMVVALLDAPERFVDTFDGLPDGVEFRAQLRGRFDVVVTFVTERARLEKRLPAILRTMERDGALWVCWPKKASKQPTDMTEDVVREVVLPLGLVDVKVAAVDETWSGLKVVWRKERRQPS